MIRKLFSSSSVLLAHRIAIQAIAALAQLIIIPFLSPGEFGEFLLLVSIGNLLSPFLHWGISISITKHASGNLENRALIAYCLGCHGKLMISLGTTFLALAGAGLVMLQLWQDHSDYGFLLPLALVLFLVVSTALASATELVASQTLLALDKVKLAAFLSGGPRNILFLLFIAISLLIQKPDLYLVALLQIVAGFAGFAISVFAYVFQWHDARRDGGKLDDAALSEHFVTSQSILSLGASSMGSYFLAQARHSMEPVLIRVFFGVELTGLVGAARRIANIINMAAQSFSAILGPYAARYKQPGDRIMLNNMHGAVSLATAVLCLAGVVFMSIFGSAPLVAIFGSDYALVQPYLLIMLALLLLRCLVGYPVYALLVRGSESDVLISYIFDLTASGVVYLVAWYAGNVTFAIVGVGLVQFIQYAWLWRQAQKKLQLRTDAFVLTTTFKNHLMQV